MADDIDELLDEVESKYISSDDRLDVQTTIVSSHDNRSCDNTEGGVEELDAAISSICSIPEPIGVSSVNPAALQIAKENPRKCRVFYVGAPQISTTATVTTNNVTPRGCNNIRCIACDFRVSQFEDFAWDPTTDYLFLRLHMPIFEKVRAKLQRKKGWVALACQCSYLSVKEVTEFKRNSGIKWVCGGHPL